MAPPDTRDSASIFMHPLSGAVPKSDRYPACNMSESELKPYEKVHFNPSKDEKELMKRLEECTDPNTLFFDLRLERARELLIFMEETKIWKELLTDCIDRSGVNSGKACRQLNTIVDERIQYYNSSFNPDLRPTLTPGIPPHFESRRKEDK